MDKATSALTTKVNPELAQLAQAAAAEAGVSVSEWLRVLVQKELQHRAPAPSQAEVLGHQLAALEGIATVRALLEFLIRGTGSERVLRDGRPEVDGLAKAYLEELAANARLYGRRRAVLSGET